MRGKKGSRDRLVGVPRHATVVVAEVCSLYLAVLDPGDNAVVRFVDHRLAAGDAIRGLLGGYVFVVIGSRINHAVRHVVTLVFNVQEVQLPVNAPALFQCNHSVQASATAAATVASANATR